MLVGVRKYVYVCGFFFLAARMLILVLCKGGCASFMAMLLATSICMYYVVRCGLCVKPANDVMTSGLSMATTPVNVCLLFHWQPIGELFHWHFDRLTWTLVISIKSVSYLTLFSILFFTFESVDTYCNLLRSNTDSYRLMEWMWKQFSLGLNSCCRRSGRGRSDM